MRTPYTPRPLWRQILDPLLVWLAFITILALWPLFQLLWLIGLAGLLIYAIATRNRPRKDAITPERESRIRAAVREAQLRRPPANAIRSTGRRQYRRRP